MSGKPQSESARRARIGILGPRTARCERCLADCAAVLGEWAVTGLCADCSTTKAKQQKVAGR